MTYKVFVLVLAVLVASSSCRSKRATVKTPTKVYYPNTRHSTHRLPPGQAKKVNGDKSAKAYAPGQQKKKHKH
ncbi:hypothetical protein [Longitalea luteola]|uniref:hypothetical protein n=1 Tax=Longitalea luteola TaxID=2812563 RepID=UPI001A95EE5B|nr:hypothetical protein [Longitalea luteola]